MKKLTLVGLLAGSLFFLLSGVGVSQKILAPIVAGGSAVSANVDTCFNGSYWHTTGAEMLVDVGFIADTGPGNLLVASTSIDTLVTNTYTDQVGGTWVNAQSATTPVDTTVMVSRGTLGFSLNAVGGHTEVSNTFSAPATAYQSLIECHRTVGTWSEDQGSKATGSFGAPDPGTITPTTAPEVVIVHVVSPNFAAVSTPTGWNLAHSEGDEYLYWKVVTTTAPVSFGSTDSISEWSAQIDSFK